MGFLDFLFGGKQQQIADFVEKKAVILDVRTHQEYNNGAIKGAKHIPLQDLQNNLDTLKKLNKPFIVYCQSGVRSAKATKILNTNSIEAVNGGGMMKLSKALK